MDSSREGEPRDAGAAVARPAQPPKEVPAWRAALPILRGRYVVLREPTREDMASLWTLLGHDDAPRFGIVDPLSDDVVSAFIDRVLQGRSHGASFTYLITMVRDGSIAGILQVRQLDATFETSECECVILPRLRRRDAFMEAAHLAGSFAFETVGARRIESRVPLHDRRANGALRKLGAAQEAVLRRSMRQGSEYVDQALWAIMKDDWRTELTGSSSRWIH